MSQIFANCVIRQQNCLLSPESGKSAMCSLLKHCSSSVVLHDATIFICPSFPFSTIVTYPTYLLSLWQTVATYLGISTCNLWIVSGFFIAILLALFLDARFVHCAGTQKSRRVFHSKTRLLSSRSHTGSAYTAPVCGIFVCTSILRRLGYYGNVGATCFF